MTTTENFNGSNASGLSGASNRILTLTNTSLTIDNGFEVFVNGLFLHLTSDYTVNHLSSNTTLTFLNPLYDDQNISVNYEFSSPSPSAGAGGISPLDAQIFNNEITFFGDLVTVRVVTDTTYSDYGDATETTSDNTNIKSVINDFTSDEIKESEGILNGDSKRFFFENTRTDINEGNRIIFNSINYEIIKVVKGTLSSNTYIIEAWGNKT